MVESRVVMGASAVTMPSGKVLKFITLRPNGEEDDGVERHGISFKEYRCPDRVFRLAISKKFPHIADVGFITTQDGGRPKIDSYTYNEEASEKC